LEQYSKCVFLDADCFVLRPIDDLFEREEFSAAPDAVWPDHFNSGVFVYQPSKETFSNLISLALKPNSSFDGLFVCLFFSCLSSSFRVGTQADDSDGRKRRLKRPETAIKRCFNALNFAVFYRNPSSRITGRFFR
jgi:hypothetical protein